MSAYPQRAADLLRSGLSPKHHEHRPSTLAELESRRRPRGLHPHRPVHAPPHRAL